MPNEGSDWHAHVARIRAEIKAANEEADSLERILPNFARR